MNPSSSPSPLKSSPPKTLARVHGEPKTLGRGGWSNPGGNFAATSGFTGSQGWQGSGRIWGHMARGACPSPRRG